MTDGGFVVIWRKLFDHPLWLGMTPGQRCVLIACIEMSNWKDGRMWSRSQQREIPIPRGSFVATQERIAERANVTRKVVRCALDQLEAGDFIRRTVEGPGKGHDQGHKQGHTFTLITVTNYCKYQALTLNEGHDQGHDQGHTRDIRGTSEGHQRVPDRTIEQGNHTNTPRGSPSKQASLPKTKQEAPSPADWAAADRFRSLLLGKDPEDPIADDGQFKRLRWPWAQSFRSYRSKGGNLDRLLDAGQWALEHGYVIATPAALVSKARQIRLHQQQDNRRGRPEPEEVLL